MTKDGIITFRISSEEKAAWIAEAKKRGKNVLSQFIKDCVFRVIGGAEDNRILSILEEIKENKIDFKPLTAELTELKCAIIKSTNILEGKSAEMSRIVRESIDPNTIKVVLDYLKIHGKATLDVIARNTGIEEHVMIFNALQMLVDLEIIIMNINKRPTNYELKV